MMKTREFTGWHALMIFGGAFSIIIAVNLTLAFNAVATFPGLETRNSYVASQSFNADRAAQDGLNWQVDVGIVDGILTVEVTDEDELKVRPAEISATLGRATHVAEDQFPTFEWDSGAYVADANVASGYWNLRLEMVAEDGTKFRRRIPLNVSASEAQK